MDLLTQRLDAQGKALEVFARRQQVLASNIANADTPGYQARDVDFAKALAQATGGGAAAGKLVATAAGHIGGGGGGGSLGEASTELLYRRPEQPSLDGNTVDMHRERANFAANALQYETALRAINGNVRTMLSAITGQ